MREIIEGIAELDELLSSMEPPGFEAAAPEPDLAVRPEPVRFVSRELQTPDGSVIRVNVPVYAAFTGQAPDEEPAQSERDPDAPPIAEDLEELLAAEDADD